MLATILKTELELSSATSFEPFSDKCLVKAENANEFEANLVIALEDMFDSSAVDYKRDERSVSISVDQKSVHIDLRTLLVEAPEDEKLEQIVAAVIKQLKSVS